MSLKTCKDCQNQYSREAKACPNCGAPNRYLSPIVKWGGGFVLVCFVVSFLITGGKDVRPPLPACTSEDAAENFKSVFNNSPYARMANLTSIDAVDAVEVSKAPDGKSQVCKATLMLNNAGKERYQFTFTPAKDGRFYIMGQPAEK